MKLIDKDILIAEIDKQKIGYNTDGNHSVEYDTTRKILDIINTLEVKEVDLDGISRQYALNNTPWDDCVDEIQNAYKAGFKLGLNAHKRE